MGASVLPNGGLAAWFLHLTLQDLSLPRRPGPVSSPVQAEDGFSDFPGFCALNPATLQPHPPHYSQLRFPGGGASPPWPWWEGSP